MTVLAVQIGVNDFAACRVAEDVDEDDVRRVPIPAVGVWEAFRDLLLDAAEGQDVEAVGIASPGPVDMSAGVVAPAGIREWQTGFALTAAVSEVFPAAKVQIGLDGVCSGLAEHNFGATAEVMDSITLMVSEHVTAGVMVGGFVVVGRTGNAGNFGHILVPGFDDSCDCGGRGCVDAIAGGRSLVRWARGQGFGGDSVEALISAAAAGDQVATAALQRAGTALGRAIASVAPLLDFDLVVLGGTVSKAGPALWKPLNAAVATHARIGFLTGLRVIPSEIDDVGVLAGAGVLGLMAAS
ncbi:ROK family protein [Nocardia nova SH22a]|uniref:ROK family protein n=1 Tax=Nocardia nova SH22a TaxID=1415166 RepID=W5TB89_9NOCA|nr:ROK family protein [Nocardia nova]AHH16389.1 ROK family protein [Nocardia nova SH22a]